MNNEILRHYFREGRTMAIEGAVAALGFTVGGFNAAALIRQGPEFLIRTAEEQAASDHFANLMHVTTQVGIPPALTVGVILLLSAGLVLDIGRRAIPIVYFLRR